MMYLKNVGKRALALVLALMMCVGMLSTTVFAEDVPEVKETEESTQAEVKETETEANEPEQEEVVEVQSKAAAKAICAHWDIGNAKSTWETVRTTPKTCSEYAIEHQVCSKCGDTRDVLDILGGKADHTWSTGDDIEVVTEPTCVGPGIGRCSCKNCEAKKLVEIPAQGHNWVITKDAVDLGEIGNYDTNVWHTEKCSKCKILRTERHAFALATCTAPETCPCGHVKLGSTALGHSFTNYVSDGNATCTADGTKTATCSRCTETKTVADEGSVLGHDWADATCTEPKSCKRVGCGATEGSAMGHRFAGDMEPAGTGHAQYCEVCKTAHDIVKPHVYSDVWTVVEEATGTEEGLEERYCDVCGGGRQTRTITKTPCEHNNLVKIKDQAATCTLPALEVWECEDCQDFKQTVVLSQPLDHDFSEHVGTASKDATCTEKGVDVYKCSRCPEKQVTELPLKSHTREDVAEKPATCTETGTKAHWKCTVCEKLFVGPGTGTSEVKAEDLVIPIDLNNHTGLTDVWTPVDDSTHGKFCEDCGNQYETGDHSFDAWVYNEAEQNWSRTCVDCGYTQTTTDASAIHDCAEYWSEDFLPSGNGHAHVCTFPGCGNVSAPEAHEFEEWEVITAARPGVAGERAHTCWICGLTETETIPALPDTGTGTGGGDVVIDDTDTPLGGGDEVELDDNAIPLAGPVTRAEFVDYLYRREGSPEAGLSTFEDVPADHEYAYAIGWGQANDIAYGVSATEFLPDELVTVGQAKLFLSRYAKLKGIEMPELAALVGLDDQDYAMNCDEILGEFFGADE